MHAKTSSAILVFLCAFLPWHITLAFNASVDRHEIYSNESLTLNLNSNDNLSLQSVDLLPIQSDFEIESQHTKNFSQIFNGAIKNQTTLSITLRPKREGKLTIPALKVNGKTTKPISIEVKAPKASKTDLYRDGITISTQIDRSEAVRQQQIIYTLRIETVLQLSALQLSPLQSEAFDIIEQKEKQYQRKEQNRNIHVIEKSYLLFPRKSGSLKIPSQTLSAVTGGNDLFSFYRQRSQQERFDLQTGAKDILVSDIPLSNEQLPASTTPLPAKELLMVEIWHSDLQETRTGEPITRQIQISAKGQRAEALPELTLKKINGANIYPEAVNRENTMENGELIGKANYHFAIIPTKDGTLTLPDISFAWWNTESEKIQYAEIPRQTINVAPASNSSSIKLSDNRQGIELSSLDKNINIDAPSSKDANAENENLHDKTASSENNIAASYFWQIISGLLAAAWLATAILLIYLWRKLNSKTKKSLDIKNENSILCDEEQHYKALIKASKNNNALDSKRALTAWLALQNNISEKDNKALAENIATLNQSLFSEHAAQSNWSGSALVKIVDQIRQKKHLKDKTKAPKGLPPLYPETKP